MWNVIAAVALGVLLPLLAYRLLWRRRYGRTGVEGYYLRLRGAVCRFAVPGARPERIPLPELAPGASHRVASSPRFPVPRWQI